MDNNLNNHCNQDVWQQQPIYDTPQQPLGKNYDTAVLVLGIVSIATVIITLFSCCCAPISIVTAIIGIIFAIITAKNGYPWNAMRIIGLVLCIVSILSILLFVIFIMYFIYSPAGQQAISEFMKMYEEALTGYSDFQQ